MSSGHRPFVVVEGKADSTVFKRQQHSLLAKACPFILERVSDEVKKLFAHAAVVRKASLP